MGSVHGRAPYRQIVVSFAGGQRVVQTLAPGTPNPSDAQLEAIAKAFRLGGDSWEGQQANGGLPVRAYVVKAPGSFNPFRHQLNPEEYDALAGLGDDGSYG